MDEKRPVRRRSLTEQEQKAMEKQRRKQREIARKNSKQDAKYRENIRKQARKNGVDSNVVIEIPARPQPPKKRRKKTTPDIIKAETNKRVRKLSPTDYDDGYYVDEVKVRKAQAQKQRKRRQRNQPKPISPTKRKFLRILTYVSICLVVVVIGVTLSLTVLFKSESIKIQGNKYYDENLIIELAEVTKGDNIFIASIFGNEDAISEKLPYVKDANIKFKIPNEIVIKITHETPYYAVKVSDGYYLLNEQGRILEKTTDKPKDLMRVKVSNIESAEIGQYLSFKNSKVADAMDKISQSILNNNFDKITEVDLSKISSLSITYDDRILIKIGMPQDIDYKLRTAFKIINDKLDPNKLNKIKGVLNVSECNTTKKSYFNEGEIDEIENNATTTATEATVETETVLLTYVTTPAADDSNPYGQVETNSDVEDETEVSEQ